MKNEEVTPMTFKDDGEIPNNEELPVLLYSGVFQGQTEDCEKTFKKHNWTNSWVGSIHDYHHYHSNTHEVLGIINGSARIRIGGINGTTFDLQEGDVMVLPAGTGHKKMSSSFDFRVVGAYPNGAEYNEKTGEPDERPNVLTEIKNVPLPEQDPVFGEDGPLLKTWYPDE